MIYLLIFTILFALLEAMRDAYAILSHTYSARQNLSHAYAWVSRALSVCVVAYGIYRLPVPSAIAAFMMGFVFWLVFEIALNLKRGKHPFYVGANAATDKQIRELSEIVQLSPEKLNALLKILAGIGIAAIYILLM